MAKDPTLMVDEKTQADMEVENRCDGGLPWSTYESWLEDIRNQPAWRKLADKCADYYDCNQHTAEEIAELEAAGMVPTTANIIRPVIDTVLGMEAKTRQDFKADADSEDFVDVAEYLSGQIKEAERESGADKACSDGYAAQIKAGIGWVQVGRNMDPYGYKYKTRYIHRREIWWDWRNSFEDGRFQFRRRWYDRDQLMATFPDQKELISRCGGHHSAFDRSDFSSESTAEALVDAHNREMRTTIDELEWIDRSRDQICLTEVWYKTFHFGPIIRIGHRVIPADTNNLEIAIAIAMGKIKVQQARYHKVRMSYWIGPHRVIDIETKRRNFPYIPFFGFTEDRTGAPYGLVRPMLDPQDEFNDRRSKLRWLLSAKRIFADSDALDQEYNDFSDLEREAARPDAVIVTNPDRRNANAIKVETDHGLANHQFEIMKDAQDLLQQTAGVYPAMMGDTGGATSGYAINSLVEQGATTLAEINDNYRHSRRLVGQALMDLIIEDIGGDPVEVMIGQGSRARSVILNQQLEDGSIANDVLRANIKCALNDVPSTPSYRAQQLQHLAELTKALPQNVQAMIIDFVIEATDLSNRKEIADRIRNGMGITDEASMSDEEKAQVEAMAQQQQAREQEATAAEMRKLQAEASEKEASAAQKAADATKTEIEAQALARDLSVDEKIDGLAEHVGALTAIVQQLAVSLQAQQPNQALQ
jgi:hypothetical protein